MKSTGTSKITWILIWSAFAALAGLACPEDEINYHLQELVRKCASLSQLSSGLSIDDFLGGTMEGIDRSEPGSSRAQNVWFSQANHWWNSQVWGKVPQGSKLMISLRKSLRWSAWGKVAQSSTFMISASLNQFAPELKINDFQRVRGRIWTSLPAPEPLTELRASQACLIWRLLLFSKGWRVAPPRLVLWAGFCLISGGVQEGCEASRTWVRSISNLSGWKMFVDFGECRNSENLPRCVLFTRF